jgi:hypothetical protein
LASLLAAGCNAMVGSQANTLDDGQYTLATQFTIKDPSHADPDADETCNVLPVFITSFDI